MFYIREQSLNTNNPVYQSLDANGFFLPAREIAQRFATHGADERPFIEWVLSMMDTNKVFVDIGANIGTWTIPFASKAKHVFSFECTPRAYNTLCANIALHELDDKVTPVRTAIGNYTGKAVLRLRGEDGTGNTCLPDDTRGIPYETPMQTLDSFNIQNIGIIKVDVEGLEKEVFEGMRLTLARNRFPPVFFESWHPGRECEGVPAKQLRDELFDVIESIGYRIVPIQGQPEQFIAEGVGVPTYWNGHYSKCAIGGPIDKFVKEHYPGIHIVASDGIGGGNTPPEHYPDAKYVGALCTRIPKDNLVLLPLDDKTFEQGLFKDIDIPSWESRKSIVFWRGGASGHENPCLRERVVKHLCGVPNTDVKLTKWWDWEKGKDLKEEHFGNRCSVLQHLRYKYLAIIDGNCIASNHQWVFGSGSVPLLISHPDNDFWFKRYIEPMVHYIPIEYDLSNLNDVITWLVSHDDEAKQIAMNALELSKRIFSPEFQREYLLKCRRV